MKHSAQLWPAILKSLNRRSWTPLSAIYAGVAKRVVFDPDDFTPEAPHSTIPKWKRNVRNVLQRRKALGHVDWDRAASYKLP